MQMHPNVEPFAFLLGTWSGEGVGEYPTISTFGYAETITFSHVGKPFMAYSQRTNALDDSRGLHVEVGYWRFPSPQKVELVVAHPTGIVEVEAGDFVRARNGGVIRLETTTIGLTATAKSVTALHRTFEIDGDVMRYTVAMGAVGLPLQHHLAATLTRQP